MRDAAITEADHKLWQEHTLKSPDAKPAWEGAEDLLERGLVLVAENDIAGRFNGIRLRERAPLLTEPVPVALESIVVK